MRKSKISSKVPAYEKNKTKKPEESENIEQFCCSLPPVPEISRKYTMQTFGDIDTVMVLFEDVDGSPTYLSGDDDSGTKQNASIEMRLLRDRTYYLRLRLYYSNRAGNGAVMVW